MKPKTLVLMGVAIACGLGASYMTSRLLAERQTDDDPKIDVLVAKKNLNMGDTIKAPEELFQLKRFTKGEEPERAVTDMEQLKNRVLKRPLRPGDHVTPEDMFGENDSNDVMSFMLAHNHRAVGVKVNVESAAFGFACLPLSRVDIISTVRRADDKATYSQILLENVLVLAADDKMRRGEDGKPMPSQVVTLALTPEELLKVRLAGEMGTLSLALRKINDLSKAENAKLTYDALKRGDGPSRLEEEVAKKPEPAPTTKTDTAPPVVQLKSEPKAPPRKHVVAVSDGGKTRYFHYYFNDNNELVQPEASESEETHLPRPQDAVVEPNTKK